MRKLCYLMMPILLGCIKLAAQRDTKPVKSIAKSARVFINGATVQREVKTTIEPGITILSVGGLSASLVPPSLSVNGGSNATILGIQFELNYLEPKQKTVFMRSLEDSIKSLEYQLQNNTSLIGVFIEEEALLKANKSIGGANIGVDKDALEEVANFFRERMIGLKGKQAELNRESTRLQEEIGRLRTQVGEELSKGNKPTGVVYITLQSKVRTEVNFMVNYFVNGASWYPIYDIRAKDTKSDISLIYKANISQSTGEDWANIKLTLSTGNPSLGGTKPELEPLYLNYYQPQQAYDLDGRLNGMSAAPMMLEDVVVTGKRQDKLFKAPITNVQQNMTNVDFAIEQPYSLISGDKPLTVEVNSFELPAKYIYAAVPKLDKDAFLIAKIGGWDDLNLEAGEANIYFEGGYVGKSILDPRSVSDSLQLSLGRDKRIVVMREKRKDESSKKGFGKFIEKELNYLISVRNSKTDAIEIIIEDQFPLSSTSDIIVTRGNLDGGVLDDQSGKVQWTLSLNPGEKIEKRINYTIKHPKDKPLISY
ncbi:MAG: hypothetical protein RIQ89_1004 [Bacteroidota bacterium]